MSILDMPDTLGADLALALNPPVTDNLRQALSRDSVGAAVGALAADAFVVFDALDSLHFQGEGYTQAVRSYQQQLDDLAARRATLGRIIGRPGMGQPDLVTSLSDIDVVMSEADSRVESMRGRSWAETAPAPLECQMRPPALSPASGSARHL